MSEKRPKDMTPAELRALPIGPWEERFEPWTEADIRTGKIGRGRMVRTCRKVRVHHYLPDDILAAPIDGRLWTFGQFDDGQWFRQVSAL